MYDIIGDIHGQADFLKRLLLQLGYSKQKGVYSHPERKAIFLGDFVDRGPDVRKVLKMVRKMIDAGHALAVLGNHEYNVIAYCTLDENGRPLRPHTAKNTRQLQSTLNAFEKRSRLFKDYLKWFKTLPLFLDLDGLRIVHAAWQYQDINFIRKNYPSHCLTDELLHRSVVKGNREYKTVSNLLTGIEAPLPKDKTIIDNDGNRRDRFRICWWEDLFGKTYRQAAVRDGKQLPEQIIPANLLPVYEPYPANASPLFIGHYCLNGLPRLMAENVCCIDFCVIRHHRLAAYRWDGEQSLLMSKLVIVR